MCGEWKAAFSSWDALLDLTRHGQAVSCCVVLLAPRPCPVGFSGRIGLPAERKKKKSSLLRTRGQCLSLHSIPSVDWGDGEIVRTGGCLVLCCWSAGGGTANGRVFFFF